MASIKHGDVFWVNFDPTVGSEAQKTRPAVVVSNDINNEHSPIVSICPITSNVSRVYSFEVEVPAGSGGLLSRSKVMTNQTRAVDILRLGGCPRMSFSPSSALFFENNARNTRCMSVLIVKKCLDLRKKSYSRTDS